MDVAAALSDQGIRLRDYDVGEHKAEEAERPRDLRFLASTTFHLGMT